MKVVKEHWAPEVRKNGKYDSCLDKKYVLEHGTDFDEKLWFTSYSDEVLDNPEDEGGKPFSGLAYELYENGELAYYSYYNEDF